MSVSLFNLSQGFTAPVPAATVLPDQISLPPAGNYSDRITKLLTEIDSGFKNPLAYTSRIQNIRDTLHQDLVLVQHGNKLSDADDEKIRADIADLGAEVTVYKQVQKRTNAVGLVIASALVLTVIIIVSKH